MGVYVGPFVRVTVPLVRQPRNQCWCEKCNDRRGDTKFCADCGTPITLWSEWTNMPVPHWSIPALTVLCFGVIDEERGADHVDYIYTVGNGRTQAREVQPDDNNLERFWVGRSWWQRGATDYQHAQIPEDIAWLRARCQKEIESIGRVFGEGNVKFGWGLVTNWR